MTEMCVRIDMKNLPFFEKVLGEIGVQQIGITDYKAKANINYMCIQQEEYDSLKEKLVSISRALDRPKNLGEIWKAEDEVSIQWKVLTKTG